MTDVDDIRLISFKVQYAEATVRMWRASKKAVLDVAIGRPTRWDPDEYVMISRWENEQALVQFAGSDWHQAIIPAGMEKFVESCSVHHYEAW